MKSLYERVELRLWSRLPTRTRRRLTTYGLAELSLSPPLKDLSQGRGRGKTG